MQQTLFANPVDPPVVVVYTDGGCDPNPGPGGWAAVLRLPDRETVLAGNAPHTTNNRMEIEAAIAALAYLSGRYGRCQIDLHTDSEYLRQGITAWIEGWFARGWRTKGGQPIKNQALWRTLYDLTHAHEVRWHWVRGHAGDPLNERVDRLVQEARAGLASLQEATVGTPDAGQAQAERSRSEAASDYVSLPSSPPADAPSPSAGVDREPQVRISIGVSCRGGTGPGGWAAVLRTGQARKVLRGHEERTTSNVLALVAAIAGLKALTEPSRITLYTQHHYLGMGASQWVHNWQRRGWKTRGGESVKNREHWEALLQVAREHQISWRGIKGEPLPEDLAEAKEIATQEAQIAR